jgi:UDP-N-acetylmuramate dehydrogenase
MKLEEIKNFSKKIKGKILFNYNLKKTNWFNIGGSAKVFFKPDNLNELVNYLKNYRENQKIIIIGAGSNILIKDEEFNGTIIKFGKNFNHLSLINKDTIVAGSATTDKQLSEFALRNELSGFEFLSCIPGTIGGGIRMNSGCFNSEFKDILISVQALEKSGKIITIPVSRINFEYRGTNLPNDLIFLSASFKGKKKIKKNIEAKMVEFKKKKEKAQPTKIKTGGSTFKNPIKQTDKKVWELIKESVSNDLQFGDATISNKHFNFFVNKKDAKFKDMELLINHVKKNVKKKTGIVLDLEIKIIG